MLLLLLLLLLIIKRKMYSQNFNDFPKWQLFADYKKHTIVKKIIQFEQKEKGCKFAIKFLIGVDGSLTPEISLPRIKAKVRTNCQKKFQKFFISKMSNKICQTFNPILHTHHVAQGRKLQLKWIQILKILVIFLLLQLNDLQNH